MNFSNPAAAHASHRTHAALRARCVALALPVLVACSSEPSQADIERAVQAQMNDAQRTLGQFGNSARQLAGKVHSVKKIACTGAGNKVFTCDVEIDASEGLTGARMKTTSSLRLVAASDGWKISH